MRPSLYTEGVFATVDVSSGNGSLRASRDSMKAAAADGRWGFGAEGALCDCVLVLPGVLTGMAYLFYDILPEYPKQKDGRQPQ